MSDPAERLCKARLQSGRNAGEIAYLSGISVNTYYDLETHPSDLLTAASLREVSKICQVVNIRPVNLYGIDLTPDMVDSPLTFPQLADQINIFLSTHAISCEQLEIEAGWEIAAFLNNPSLGWDWNIDCLHDVCQYCGVDWGRVLLTL